MSKTYLLTGASSGIGLAIYKHLVKSGYKVVVVARSSESIKNLPTAPLKSVICDMADSASVEKAFSDLDIRLDGVINSAGILHGNSIYENTHNSLQECFNINVISPMLMVKSCSKLLNEGSCIVLLGSTSGHKGSYDDGYAASKGAVHSLVRSLALKFAPKTRVVGIAPGMTEHTRMTDELVEGRFEHNLKTIPLQIAGQPQDLAELIAFIISDKCKFMTGAIIDVNGGQYLRS